MYEKLCQVTKLKAQLLSQNSPTRSDQPLHRRKQGDIQNMVLTVLSESEKPLSVGQVHGLVEERLGQSVSRHTVCSCLTVGARQKKFGLRRVGVGVYEIKA